VSMLNDYFKVVTNRKIYKSKVMDIYNKMCIINEGQSGPLEVINSLIQFYGPENEVLKVLSEKRNTKDGRDILYWGEFQSFVDKELRKTYEKRGKRIGAHMLANEIDAFVDSSPSRWVIDSDGFLSTLTSETRERIKNGQSNLVEMGGLYIFKNK